MTTTITRAATSDVTWLRAPAASATAVRESLALIGRPWVAPDTRLATPSAISSWLASMR